MNYPKKDHNEREFKHLIMGGMLDLLEKFSKTREASYKWSTTLSILALLKIFSEEIGAPKPGSLARTEKQAMS